MTFESVVTVDTKVNMLKAASIWGLNLPMRWRKDEIAYSLKHEAQYVWDNLGQEAIDMIGDILET